MKLHVSNLSPKTTKEHLAELFARYGIVVDLEMKWIKSAGRVSGVAILHINSPGAVKAAGELNGRQFRNRRIYIAHMEQSMRGSK